MPASTDFYEELQVSPNADPEIIEAAYRRLARKYHPDVSTDPASAARMRRIVRAYEVLRDPQQRAAYDATHARSGPFRRTGAVAARGGIPHMRAWLSAGLIILLIVLALPVTRALVLRGFVFIVAAAVVIALGWYVWRRYR